LFIEPRAALVFTSLAPDYWDSFAPAHSALRAFARSGLRFDLFSFPLGQGTALSFVSEQFPFRDAVSVAEERRHRQFLRRARLVEQLQPGFVRQAIARPVSPRDRQMQNPVLDSVAPQGMMPAL